jgi:ubiquinone/menaquinone biosynthesis C-methylase UbiE
MSTDKGYKGIGMEGFVARWYTRNTAGRDFHPCVDLVARHAADRASILEVAPGPGYLAILLAQRGTYRVVGLDISRTFVEIATARAKEAGVAVEFRHGNAAAMPFDADSFDIIVCVAAFKNFSQPVKALGEMHRVLKPDGKAFILDLRPDASREAIKAEVNKMELSWFNSLLTKFTFRHLLLKRACTQEQFRQMASESPFHTCEIQEDPIGLTVILTKRP